MDRNKALRLASTIAVVLLLGVGLQAPGFAGPAAQAPTPSQSELLFFDDFSDPDSGWPQTSLNPTDYDRGYENGEYRIRIKVADLLAWAPREQVFSDFDVRVKARALEAPRFSLVPERSDRSEPRQNWDSRNVPPAGLSQGFDGTYDLLFRYVDGDNFYRFEISPYGQWYRLSKQVNDDWINIDSGSSPHINTGTAINELRIVAAGSRIDLFVNDHHLMEATDTSFSAGWFALSAGAFDQPGMNAAFDDFQVFSVGTANVTPTPSEVPTDALFADNFDNPDSGWPPGSSDPDNVEQGYGDSRYHVFVKQESLMGWGQRVQLYSDFDARVRVQRSETPFASAGASTGPGQSSTVPHQRPNVLQPNAARRQSQVSYSLLFRYKDGDNFYNFEVSPSAGQYRVNKQFEGEWVDVHPWTSSPHINTGTAPNELRVVANGPDLSVFVNGNHLVDIHDTSFTHGWFALAATNFDDPAGMHAVFDDFAVFGPGLGGDIFGEVTFNGANAPDGTTLELRFWDGSSWWTASEATTAGRMYHFTNLPDLDPEQRYYVRYSNTDRSDNYLWVWWCNTLESYRAGTQVRTCDFDISNVSLGSPDTTSAQSWPVSFSWARRNHMPSDSYVLHMWDSESEAEFFSEELGHVGGHTLENLPEGFTAGREYFWDLWIGSPDGTGVSFDTNTVKFGSLGPNVRQALLPAVFNNHGTPLIVTPAPSPTPVPLCNGGFEGAGFAPCWNQGGQLATRISSEQTHAGGQAAVLGNPDLGAGARGGLPMGKGWIEQEFGVPSTASPALLFWYRIHTYDKAYSVSTQEFWDTLVVRINNQVTFRDGYCWNPDAVPQGPNEQVCIDYEAPTSPRVLGWRQGRIDLTPYRGQTVTVHFANWNDETAFRPGRDNTAGAFNTWTYLDDVQLVP